MVEAQFLTEEDAESNWVNGIHLFVVLEVFVVGSIEDIGSIILSVSRHTFWVVVWTGKINWWKWQLLNWGSILELCFAWSGCWGFFLGKFQIVFFVSCVCGCQDMSEVVLFFQFQEEGWKKFWGCLLTLKMETFGQLVLVPSGTSNI